MLHPETPPAARALGLAGLVPFWVAALAVVFAEGEVEAAALRAQVAYGAVILTFLGGVHWGLAPHETGWARLGWGVAPSLLGWIALLMAPRPALALLAASLAAALFVDLRSLGAGVSAAWYLPLRRLLTAAAVASIALSLLVA
jgi:hypothetical protein